MWSFFDHLNASVVASLIAMMLVGVHLRVAEINMERTSYYTVTRLTRDLSTWLERDLLRMGEGMDLSTQIPFENPVDSTGMTVMFTFFRDTTVNGSPQRLHIRYRLERGPFRNVAGEVVRLHRIIRELSLDGNSWWTDGSSPMLISGFRIQFLDGFLRPVVNPVGEYERVRNMRVTYTMVTPYEVSIRSSLKYAFFGSTLLIYRYPAK